MNLLKTKKQWLRISDLSKEFGISRSTAYEWAAAGAFGVPFQPAGPSTALLFSRRQIEKALRDSQEKLSAELGILLD
jgi:predicted DNA-binding transcriptional regulator AlpA